MTDERRLYICQLLRNYQDYESFTRRLYTVNYRFTNDKEDRHRFFEHNEGIDFVINYIRELEKKVDGLQHIERIIELAKKE